MINILLKKWMMALVGSVLSLVVMAQTGSLSGTVTDKNSLQLLPGITVTLKPGDLGKTTDSKGNFRFTDIKPSSWNSLSNRPTDSREVPISEANSVLFKLSSKIGLQKTS
jgi:hypothetical protein